MCENRATAANILETNAGLSAISNENSEIHDGSKYLLLDFSVLQNNQQAGHDRGLMHIEPTTTFYQGLQSTSLAEAIAAPKVCYRHCSASFPFLGATKSGTFTGAGQSA